VGDFNLELEKYIYKYNNYRPHKELDYLTPKEYYLKLVETGNFVPNVSGL
jgi:transposase InsO family protein